MRACCRRRSKGKEINWCVFSVGFQMMSLNYNNIYNIFVPLNFTFN